MRTRKKAYLLVKWWCADRVKGLRRRVYEWAEKYIERYEYNEYDS